MRTNTEGQSFKGTAGIQQPENTNHVKAFFLFSGNDNVFRVGPHPHYRMNYVKSGCGENTVNY